MKVLTKVKRKKYTRPLSDKLMSKKADRMDNSDDDLNILTRYSSGFFSTI